MLGIYSFKRKKIGGGSAPLYFNEHKWKGCLGAILMLLVFLAICLTIAVYNLGDIETVCVNPGVSIGDLSLNVIQLLVSLPLSMWVYKYSLKAWWSDEELSLFVEVMTFTALALVICLGAQIFLLYLAICDTVTCSDGWAQASGIIKLGLSTFFATSNTVIVLVFGLYAYQEGRWQQKLLSHID